MLRAAAIGVSAATPVAPVTTATVATTVMTLSAMATAATAVTRFCRLRTFDQHHADDGREDHQARQQNSTHLKLLEK